MNELDDRIIELPIVRVLLVTHNGELFLNQQIESIIRQNNCQVSIFCVDAGSTDSTLEILRYWKEVGHVERIEQIGSMKASAAFYYALRKVPSDLPLAFSDQDDIWNPNKISKQLSCLVYDSPQLVCHDRAIITASGIKKTDSQVKKPILHLSNALIENIVFGNTILINPEGIRLIRKFLIPTVVMYDAYMYLIFSLFGRIVFIQEPLTNYRIHNKNAIGIPSKFAKLRNFRKNAKAFYIQNKSFVEFFGEKISMKDKGIILEYFSILNAPGFLSRLFLALKSTLRRQSTYETLIWKILISTIRVY